MKNNELTIYLNAAIQSIVSEVFSATFTNPKETAFLLKYRTYSKKAEIKRNDMEARGKHIPAFLISSITHSCNLTCKGCYARDNGTCQDNTEQPMLSNTDWKNVFKQAVDLGIVFNLLAGGEPLMRHDVIWEAAQTPEIIFPIFTNGTMIDNNYLKLFDKGRNLIPILSLEGIESTTDNRRGDGIYKNILNKMDLLNQKNILFGASITVTTRNLKEVTAESFINTLKELGCRVIFFIEYVPVNPETKHLAFSDKERKLLENAQQKLKQAFSSILFISFPGDEKDMGGCLAAGRGFFHINPYGAAEACPFSPYSDRSLRDYSLLEILDSPFFKMLQTNHLVGGEHLGGCALFEQENVVKALLSQELASEA